VTKKATTPEDITGVLARANPRWGRPTGALGQCGDAAWRLMMVMRSRGHDEAVLLRAGVPQGEHYAVLLGDQVYDLTARQFDPDKPFPWIVSRADWEARQVEIAAGSPVTFTTEDR
jgi:hypothetical protein